MNVPTFLLAFVSICLTALAQICLRKAMHGAALPPLSQPLNLALTLATNVWLWGGMLCYGVSIGLWLAVLTRVPVSIAYPMASMGYVIATVLAVCFLGEAVTIGRLAGLAVICGGVFLIARTA